MSTEILRIFDREAAIWGNLKKFCIPQNVIGDLICGFGSRAQGLLSRDMYWIEVSSLENLAEDLEIGESASRRLRGGTIICT